MKRVYAIDGRSPVGREPALFWQVSTLVFFVLSLFLGFVALRNSKPVNCERIVWDELRNVTECVITVDVNHPKPLTQ